MNQKPFFLATFTWLAGFWLVERANADSQVLFLPDRKNVQAVVLENELVSYEISLTEGVALARLTQKGFTKDFLAGNPALLFSSVRSIRDVGYQILQVEDQSVKGSDASVVVTERSTYAENLLEVIQTFSLGQGPELGWNLRVRSLSAPGVGYRTAISVPSRITLPLLQKLRPLGESQIHHLFPTGNSFFCIDSPEDFSFYFTRERDPMMPIDIWTASGSGGVFFQILRSSLRFAFQDKDDLQSKVFLTDHEPGSDTEILDCRIFPHQGDWHAAFNAFREQVRSEFDFTYYERPIQQKFRQRFVSHFTFLYGHDIYDPENNRFRINEFLDEGELNFGGYDYILLWHDYPRTGLDTRDQFAMYEDLPGGLPGLRQMVNRAHARDVQVFIPYKPWDIIGERQDPYGEEARIAEAIGADGIFLDTMSASDRAFRDALDRVSEEIVFSSEGRPPLKAMELVTGSWNQNGRASNRMPNVDLLRFVLPEHNVRNINRGARKRDELILNALFNGVGLIVWEDIFGEINRFTWQERCLIKRYNRIIHENRDAFLTNHPKPLVTDLREDTYINAFPSEEKCVYPVFQLGRETASRGDFRLIGGFLDVDHPQDWHYVDVWNHQSIHAVRIDGRTRLSFLEEPADVMSCIVGFPKRLSVRSQGELLLIEASYPDNEASVQINLVDNLTMIEKESVQFHGCRGTVDISELELEFPYLVLVKLMNGDVLVDQVILDFGWKRFTE
jgi:hypothetical protein